MRQEGAGGGSPASDIECQGSEIELRLNATRVGMSQAQRFDRGSLPCKSIPDLWWGNERVVCVWATKVWSPNEGRL